VLTITVMMNVPFFPHQHMLPVFAGQVLQLGPEWLGGLVAAHGLGALLGALATAGRRGFLPHGRLFALSVLTCAVPAAGLHEPALAVGLPARARADRRLRVRVRGNAEHPVLLSAPEASRGRAMGILSACIGTQPAGTLWIGLVSGGIGCPRR
jgi:hypothetical protein